MRREPAKSFQDLIVWQKAHKLVLEVYRFSSSFPKTETYGLVSQLRRASVSVTANIAEGFNKASALKAEGRRQKAEGLSFKLIPFGSKSPSSIRCMVRLGSKSPSEQLTFCPLPSNFCLLLITLHLSFLMLGERGEGGGVPKPFDMRI